MLIAEMAAYYRTQGKTLYDAMEEMYEKYGCYCEQTISIVMPGVSGLQRMKELMQELRDKPLTQIGTHKIDYTRDYMPGTRTCMADGKSEPMELKLSLIHISSSPRASFHGRRRQLSCSAFIRCCTERSKPVLRSMLTTGVLAYGQRILSMR